jgi:hypothetical protein
MTKSREDLVNRALAKLKVVAAGQQPSAEDAKVVDDMVEPTLAELAARSIYAYGDPDQIEDECFEHLAIILAQTCAEDFGVEGNEGKRIAAEIRLREIGAETLSYQPLKADYF